MRICSAYCRKILHHIYLQYMCKWWGIRENLENSLDWEHELGCFFLFLFFNFATFLATLQHISTFGCCSCKTPSSTGITETHLNLQPVSGPSSEAATYKEHLLSGLHTPGHSLSSVSMWVSGRMGCRGPVDGTGVPLWPHWPGHCLIADLGPGLRGRSVQAWPHCQHCGPLPRWVVITD